MWAVTCPGIGLEPDLHERLVSRLGEPLDPPLGASATSFPCDPDLSHPWDSLQGELQVVFTDVHRQAWEEAHSMHDASMYSDTACRHTTIT